VSDTKKKYEARKSTGVSVEDYYNAIDETFKTDKEGKYIHSTGVRELKNFYAVFVLARVNPMPSYDEFKEWLDEDIFELWKKCKSLNPRHFPVEPAAPVGEKKSET
jgi:hypothetical protein